MKTEADNIDKNMLIVDRIDHNDGRKTSKYREHPRNDKSKKNSELSNIKENINGWY